MDKPRPRPGARKDPEVAAAEWLFQDGPGTSSTQPPGSVIPAGPVEGFDLADAPDVALAPGVGGAATSPTSAASAGAERTGSRAAERHPASRMTLEPSPGVLQAWSRAAEWGPTLLILGSWSAGVLLLVYFALGAEAYGLATMLFLAGSMVAAILSYPILITLERPVRVTPEQAARDYFAALSHHLPHHRRMWLLLSARGRVSPCFASYEGFKNYWNTRVGQLRQGHAGPLSPLVFVVSDFRAEKSGGKTEIDGKFTVNVFVRGRRGAGPIANFTVERTFTRGPDNMWYLDDGTLSDPPKPKRASRPDA
jgi:hypothetical protein